MMKFHGYFRSSSAHRCRIAFNLLGLEPKFQSVHLRRNGGEQNSAEYKALNAQALLPTLEVDGLVLTQSLAIIEWLNDTYDALELLPANKGLRAKVRAFSQIIACDVHPLQNLRVLMYLKSELGQDQDAADAWCQRWISDGLTACEVMLERNKHDGNFCFGNTPSLADICLIPQIYSAQRFGVNLESMPRLREIFDTCEASSAFANARPSVQPDAEN